PIQRRDMHGATVKRDKLGSLVKMTGGMVAGIDGQFEARDVLRRRQGDGLSEDGGAEPSSSGGRGQAEVRNLPGVAIDHFRKQEDRACVGLSFHETDPPALWSK